MPRQKEPTTELGRRLISLRRARGLTQTQLARAVRSTQRAISYYEVEGGNPDTEMMVKLAQTLGVTVDQLLGVKPPPRIDSPTADANTRRYWRRFQQLMALPERDQRAVMRMIDSLATLRGKRR